VNVHFIRSPKPRNSVLEALYAKLRARGFGVSESIPDRDAPEVDLVPEHDLYVLKARGPLAVSVATVLHRGGARVVNNPAACATLLDKIVSTAMMRRAGLPVPRTWAVTDARALHTEAFSGRLPLILKPYDGIHSRNLKLVHDRDALFALEGWPSPMLVQEFIEGCRHRYKIHVVGERVFATRKPFSLGGDPEDGEPVDPGEEIATIARRCGRLFGLVLYGMDVLVGRRGPVVVDVNSFPGYAGVHEAPEALAELIALTALGRLEPTPH
jgi:glutathione synthase/RimK-type ligase-like ATP-grasp enzyme